MPFETLLLMPCLLPGQTSFKEGKTKVIVQPQPGETILFFNIDDRSNPGCKFRQFLWGNREGENICDLIVFYARGQERIVCFVELKDNIEDLGKATEQLINTYNGFKLHLKRAYTPKAYVSAFGGSLPQKQKNYQRELAKVFGEDNFQIATKSDNDLGDFLRVGASKTKGKRKKKK